MPLKLDGGGKLTAQAEAVSLRKRKVVQRRAVDRRGKSAVRHYGKAVQAAGEALASILQIAFLSSPDGIEVLVRGLFQIALLQGMKEPLSDGGPIAVLMPLQI